IEVLRGPQGTYFGRNAVGGALNITTNKPDENYYAEIGAGYERFDTWSVQGVSNIPISDTVFTRFVAQYEDSDGIVTNINPAGAPNSGFDYLHVRGAVRFVPNDDLTVDLSVSHTDENGNSDATVPSGVLDLDTKSIFGDTFVPIDTTGFFPDNIRRFDRDADEVNDNSFLIVNGRIQYDFDGFSVRSITGYMDTSNERFFDQDNIFSDTIVRENENDSSSFSQELRIQSTGDNIVDWTVGGLFARDDVENFNSIRAGADSTILHPNLGVEVALLPPIPPGFRINENNRDQEFTSWAAFVDGEWHVTDDLSLITGLRYTRDKIDFNQFDTVAFEAPDPDITGSASFDDVSPRFAINYTASEDVTLYATVSKGYKAGGLDRVRFGGEVSLREFDSESMWNYEAGVKSVLADGRVRANLSGFYLDWSDLQVQSNFLAIPDDISSATQLTLNASGATNWGFEADVVAAFTDWFTLSGAFGYVNSEFDDFPDAVLSGGAVVDVTGERLPRSPEITWSVVGDFTYPVVDEFEGFVRVEAFGQSTSRADLEAVAAPILGLPEFPYRVPSFAVVNLRLGVESPAFVVNGYIQNLFEENYYTSTTENFGLSGMRIRPQPRIWGVRFTYRYDQGR
ncbi:MAG: TonB-dependent receptor, partial [Pseudomonadota bacterium]